MALRMRLQEFLTVKSDDVMGRTRIYESIVKGENTLEPGLARELQRVDQGTPGVGSQRGDDREIVSLWVGKGDRFGPENAAKSDLHTVF